MTEPTDTEVLRELKRLKAFEVSEHPRVTVERIVRHYLKREKTMNHQLERLTNLCRHANIRSS